MNTQTEPTLEDIKSAERTNHHFDTIIDFSDLISTKERNIRVYTNKCKNNYAFSTCKLNDGVLKYLSNPINYITNPAAYRAELETICTRMGYVLKHTPFNEKKRQLRQEAQTTTEGKKQDPRELIEDLYELFINFKRVIFEIQQDTTRMNTLGMFLGGEYAPKES